MHYQWKHAIFGFLLILTITGSDFNIEYFITNIAKTTQMQKIWRMKVSWLQNSRNLILLNFTQTPFSHGWSHMYYSKVINNNYIRTIHTNACLPQTHNTRLCWALPCKCWSKVFHVHVVLSTLYQEKMITKQEMKELKPLVRPWGRLVVIQCTKPPDVVKRTAELLADVGRNEDGKQLKGQWVYSVCCCLSVVMCYLQWTIRIRRILFSS